MDGNNEGCSADWDTQILFDLTGELLFILISGMGRDATGSRTHGTDLHPQAEGGGGGN